MCQRQENKNKLKSKEIRKNLVKLMRFQNQINHTIQEVK